jgi:hypothetical protein
MPSGTPSTPHLAVFARPRRVHKPSIDEVAEHIRSAWRADSAWIDDWDAGNAPRGQCGSTALVVQDLFGGSLMRALVAVTPNDHAVHYWNVVGIGQVDLTWHQFPATATIVHGEPVERRDLLATAWLDGRYRALRDRVFRSMGVTVLTVRGVQGARSMGSQLGERSDAMTTDEHTEPSDDDSDRDDDEGGLEASLSDIPKVLPHGDPAVPPSAADAPVPPG